MLNMLECLQFKQHIFQFTCEICRRWLVDEERLPLSPVERLGFFDQSMALAKCLAMAEAQMLRQHFDRGDGDEKCDTMCM